MSDIYNVRRDTLSRIMAKKHMDAANLSRRSGVHVNTIRRYTGERNPKNMAADRREYGRKVIGVKLAYALKVKPQVIFPELPLPMPKANPPAPVPDYTPPEPGLNDWRTHARLLGAIRRGLEIMRPLRSPRSPSNAA
jgi:Cro/C1-type HTH DNA-binding domain